MKFNEGLDKWLEKHTLKTWPKNFFDFSPIKSVPDFKKSRKELKKTSEDPLT